MSRIEQTPIYSIFLENLFFWCLVSGMYIQTTVFARHRKTPRFYTMPLVSVRQDTTRHQKQVFFHFLVSGGVLL